MNARDEAVARLGGRCDARVLEPSPPAVTEPPWFTADPVGRDDPASDLWQASAFRGGELPYTTALLAENQRETALRFFDERLAAVGARG
jgi:hypothetical protein